jgi:hypothetical protein
MTHDIILKNEASLIKMGRDLEEIGYTLVEASSTTRLYNALPSAEDPEYDYQFVELTVHVAYYRGKRSTQTLSSSSSPFPIHHPHKLNPSPSTDTTRNHHC